jgi:hypothetical protein
MGRQSWKVSFREGDSFRDRTKGQPEAAEAESGQHPCARGQWCARRSVATVDGKPVTTPALCYRAFCEHDRDLILHCLADFPAIYGRLEAALGDPVTAELQIRVPFGPSVPLRGDVDAIMRLLVDVLASWEERVRTVARLSVLDTQESRRHANNSRALAVLSQSVRILTAHLDALLALGPEPMSRPVPGQKAVGEGKAPEVVSKAGDAATVLLDGAWAGNELLHLHYWCRSILRETKPLPEQLLGVECRECSHRSLRRADPPWHEGDPEYHSECMECGHQMGADEYSLWVAQLAAYERAMRRAPVLAEPAGVA